jgi:hypothetical protein
MNLRDHINGADPALVVQAAYAALSGAQSLRPHHQILGAALLFRAMCANLKLDASQLLSQAERIEKDADQYWAAEVRALRQFIQEELR